MWILSYCIAFIYLQNTKVKQLFSPLTYEDSHSPAMKQTIHICSVDNLVEEINNIIQNKQECQTMEYDLQFICCSCKITEIERKHILRKHRKKTYVWQHGTCCPLCMTTVFSNTICWAIRICPSFSNEDSSVGISSTYIFPFTTAWHSKFPFITFERHVLHIYCFPQNDGWILKYVWQGYFLFRHVITDFL